jgi:tight adherence protein B
VDGIPGTWTGSYVPLAPAPRLNIAGPTRHVPSPSFWASNLALLLVALSSAVILVGGLLFHFVPRTRQHDLRRRIGRFIRQDDKDVQAESAERGTLSERAQARLSRLRWWPRFEQEVDVAAVERSAVELVLLTLLGTVAAAALLSLVISAPVISLPVLVIGPLVLWTIIRSRADRQRRLFADQLPSHLEQIGSAMRAGHSVVASIAAMAKDAPAPTHREFERALTDESLGVPLDVALRPIAVRMASTDIDQLALVAMLNQRTGGNMAEVLDLIADAARERSELRRELRALTAQARMSRWIVTLLPPAVLGILLLVRPSYLHPLFHSTGGIIALLLATSLVVLGSVVMRILVPAEV